MSSKYSCAKKIAPPSVYPPQPKSLASVATLIDSPVVVGQIFDSNLLRRGRFFQKKSSLRASSLTVTKQLMEATELSMR